jgi:hypothetical protein
MNVAFHCNLRHFRFGGKNSMNTKYKLDSFSGPDAAIMSGFSHDTLRTWKSRGLLPEQPSSFSGYSALQVCALALRRVLVTQGMSPYESRALGDDFAPVVLFWALRGPTSAMEISDGVDGANFAVDQEEREVLASEIAHINRSAASFHTLIAIDDTPYRAAKNLSELTVGGGINIRCLDLARLGDQVGSRARRPLAIVYP